MKRWAVSILLLAGPSNAQQRPQINAVVSAADFQYGIAFEGLATVFGIGLSDQAYVAASLPLPKKLGDTELRYCAPLSAVWDQCFPMELLFVSPTQINFRIAYSGPDPTQPFYQGAFVVRHGAMESDGARRQALAAAAPRIFGMGFDCAYNPLWADPSPCRLMPQRIHDQQAVRGALTDQAGSLITSNNPAQIGKPYSLWLTGLGRLIDGKTPLEVQMTVGGIPVYGSKDDTWMWVTPSFVGYSPQFAGLDQINFELPKNLLGAGAGTMDYPPLHPCGEYKLELTLNLSEGANDMANLIQIPVLVRNGDVPCTK